jgi:hypothetical protein
MLVRTSLQWSDNNKSAWPRFPSRSQEAARLEDCLSNQLN